MVVYLTKSTDARRLLADGYFHVGGESGTTSIFDAGMSRDARSAPQKAIATVAATRQFRSAFYVGALTNRSAGIVGSSTRLAMNKTLRVMQLNVRKQGAVHDSLMNDEETQDAVALAIQEP
ncbi:uncharacterized protein N7498_001645 [Penicillium cinerascens]|uniref:Uncharacterized protein n=1 Tax=Penicillium cinerascens TaxID=70096 RepID=A0A9W9TA55_9EURO|nr:uncharacterized protein N7498_001645 [Penicillium cinerascens]KAJ5215238.1 hypothetical protein N7498_001645 [Penicillium cinerascens]